VFDITWQDALGWAEATAAAPVPPPPPDRAVTSASMLLWAEHCVECVAPQCYSSCGLYVRRRDGRCARFAYGIYPNRAVSGLFDFGADITLRRWAKIEARWTSSPALHPVDALRRRAAFVRRVAGPWRAMQWLVRPFDPKSRVNKKFGSLLRSYQKRRFEVKNGDAPTPDAFYLKFFHAGPSRRTLDFEVTKENTPVYRASFAVAPGWNEHVLAYREFPPQPPRQRGHVRLWLEGDEPARLVVTWADLVTFAGAGDAPVPAAKVKCVAWDLDNTFWDGVLAEAGPEGVRVRPAMVELVKRLDERGILNTIASKNDHDPAWTVLRKHGLADYFLHPAIHWGPKSASLVEVAKRLNINIDTFALLDDAPFERAEVGAKLPQVRTFDPASMGDLLARPEFDVPATAESRARRLMYLEESKRADVATTWGADHEGFLRDCRMVMELAPPAVDERARCHELLERTNQFNLSGRRTSMQELEKSLASDRHESIAIRVRDRFGDYGIVGFALVELDAEAPHIVEFVLSCRVASKTVEDTFFLWYAARARARGAKRLRVTFNETTRNTPLKNALGRLPFTGAGGKLEMSLADEVRVPTTVTVTEARNPNSQLTTPN
jgi:FkbH-like protein